MNEAKKIYTMDELKKIMAENNPNPKTGDFEDLLKYEDEDTVLNLVNDDAAYYAWEYRKKIENIERNNAYLQMQLLKAITKGKNVNNDGPSPKVITKKKVEEKASEKTNVYDFDYVGLEQYNELGRDEQAIVLATLCAVFDFRAVIDRKQLAGICETAKIRSMLMTAPEIRQRLNSIGVSAVDDNGYRTFYDVLRDVAVRYKDLDEEQKKMILRTMFGAWEFADKVES